MPRATKKKVEEEVSTSVSISPMWSFQGETREQFIRRVGEQAYLNVLDEKSYRYAEDVAVQVVKGVTRLAKELGIGS